MRRVCLFLFISFLTGTAWANAHLEEAAQSYNNGEYEKTIRLYQEILIQEPQNLAAALNLAYLYKDSAEYEEAIRILKNLPEDFAVLKLLGELYYLHHQPRKALPYLQEALKKKPSQPELLIYQGQCLEDLGNFARAEKNYLKAIRVDANNTLALLRLGDLYLRREEFSKAIDVFETLKSLEPSITKIHSLLGHSYFQINDFVSSYRAFAKAYTINPQDKLKEELEKVKTKLNDDFFKRQKGDNERQRRRKLIKVKSSPHKSAAPLVRIAVGRITDRVDFKSGSSFEIMNKDDGQCRFTPFEIQNKNSNLRPAHAKAGLFRTGFTGDKEKIYSLVFDKKNKCVYLKDIRETTKLLLNNSFLMSNKREDSVFSFFDLLIGEGNFWAQKQNLQYRGQIQVDIKSDAMQLINIINLEEYLYGVLPSEMPPSWPKAALKAQAIVARTRAVKNLGRYNRKEGFDFFSSTRSQVYNGAAYERQQTNQAVDETAGLILTFAGEPIEIFYSNNCGGHTQDDIFSAQNLPYLKGRLDTDSKPVPLQPVPPSRWDRLKFPLSPWDLEKWLMQRPNVFSNLEEENPANFRWVRLYKREELEELLRNKNIDVGMILKIIPQRRARSGHLISIKIEGTEGVKKVTGQNKIRTILGNLRSSAFRVDIRYNSRGVPEEFIFYGAGFGHGVGMCQSGAKGMSKSGVSAQEILGHYFPETQIKKIY
ncbi:MAG: SpoIID/LytB domain-containing protein [Candidatus Omnitrophica bacterium]|nr:SpoIID/LytB domain-containing protein [Candidatus Omnitrophota bacterium]